MNLCLFQLASQKNYIALHHMALGHDPLLSWFQARYLAETGLKPDLGKCCLRLKRLFKFPLESISELCGLITPEAWIAQHESARLRPKKS